jgi:hypothetical protein
MYIIQHGDKFLIFIIIYSPKVHNVSTWLLFWSFSFTSCFLSWLRILFNTDNDVKI